MITSRALPSAALLVVAALLPAHGQEDSLETAVHRIGAYVTDYQRQLSALVAEEHYAQNVNYRNLVPGRFASNTYRELRSDILLIQTQGSQAYTEFRDVFEVDGRPVRDRQDRLTKLFLNKGASADAQIRQITQESARYNIGNVERNTNTPTLALQFVAPENQARFRFTRDRRPDSPIDFEEIQRPTLIHTPTGLDLPVRGRLWSNAATGRIERTEISTEDLALRARIDVTYRWDERIGLMVPSEMRERYEVRRDGAVVVGVATYGNMRRFEVSTKERVGSAAPDDLPPPEPARPDAASVQREELPAPLVARQPQLPVFTTGTELVLVDFIVVDRTGRAVPGLLEKDFVVREDGRERAIVSFQAFNSAAQPSPQAPSAPLPASSPGAATVVVLVDDLHLTRDQAARLRPALKGLLATVAGRAGSLMLVAPGSNVSLLAERASDEAELSTAIDRIAGQRTDEHTTFPVNDTEALAIARRDPSAIARVLSRFLTLNPELTRDQAEELAIERGMEAAHDARARRDRLYDAMLACLDWVGTRPGRRSVVAVSGGFAADSDDGKYFDVVTRSLRANAPIDFLDARGLSSFDRYHDVEFAGALSRGADESSFGRAEATEGPTGLAVDTGGISVVNRNQMTEGLDQLLASLTTYYVVAYQPPPHASAGFRKIRVDVRTRGLRVRARSGYASAATPR